MPEKTRPASLRSKQWEWGLCLVLLAATMLNYANRQVLPISATHMMQELGLSNEEYGRIEAVFGLAFGTGALLGGCVADCIKIRWLEAVQPLIFVYVVEFILPAFEFF